MVGTYSQANQKSLFIKNVAASREIRNCLVFFHESNVLNDEEFALRDSKNNKKTKSFLIGTRKGLI